MIHWILEKLFPPKCILCGRILERNEMDLCHHCRIHAPEYSKGNLKLQFLDSWTAIWYYEENVRRSLLRYKFYNARSYAQGYGRILAMKLLDIERIYELFSLFPVKSPWFEIWQPVTYMFLHGGLTHILWNMLALYWFGKIFLSFFSTRHFVGLYLLGGIVY